MIKAKHLIGAAKCYLTVAGAVSAAAKPLTWARDTARKALIAGIVKIATGMFDERLNKAFDKHIAGKHKRIDFSVPIPKKLRKSLSEEPDLDKTIETLVNQALDAPFALVGISVAKTTITIAEGMERLDISIEAGFPKEDASTALPASALADRA